MINDHLDIETFTDRKYLDNQETLNFSKKITMLKNKELDEKVLTPQVFTVTLKNNKKIEIKLDNVYGHPKVPLSEKEYLKKFEICCQSSKKKIKTNKVDQFIDFILNVETKSNITDLFKIT